MKQRKIKERKLNLHSKVINNIILAILFEQSKVKQTIIKPDNSSSPLKVSKENLGTSTWTFLHSIAASFPQNPSEEYKTHFANLLNSM